VAECLSDEFARHGDSACLGDGALNKIHLLAEPHPLLKPLEKIKNFVLNNKYKTYTVDG